MTLEVVSPQDNLPVIRSLSELEVIVSQGLNTFVDVGNALREIRDRELYYPEYATYNDYLKIRWKFGYAQAGHLIIAAQVYGDIAHVVEAHHTNEAQMRVLAQVPSEVREVVYTLSYEATGGNPTASSIRSLAVALQEVLSTGGYITVDDSGTQKHLSKLSAEEKAAFLEAYLPRETNERRLQHIAAGKSISSILEMKEMSKITLPTEQVNTLRSLAKYAPETEKDAYRTAWRDRL